MTLAQWILWGVSVALCSVVAALAWRVGHRPVALLFAVGALQEVAIRIGQALVLEGAPKPFAGLARGVYHVETALVLGWPAWCCALTWWAFCGPRKAEGPDRSEPSSRPSRGSSAQRAHGLGGDEGSRGPLAVKATLAAWLAFSAAMAIAFPLPRGWTKPTLHVVYLACAALSGLAVMLGRSRRRERPAVVASYLLAAQIAISLVGPFVREPWEPGGWDVARVGYITLFVLLLLQHLSWLRSRQAGGLP